VDFTAVISRTRELRPHKIVIIARNREPETLVNNPARYRTLEKRLGAGDVLEVQGYDKQGILALRVDLSKQAEAAQPPATVAAPAAPAPVAHRTTGTAGGGGNPFWHNPTDPEAQRMFAFVEGQKVILGEFKGMLEPIFKGFRDVTESLANRVAALESEASNTVYVQSEPDDAEPEAPAAPSQADEIAMQVMGHVAKSMGIAAAGEAPK